MTRDNAAALAVRSDISMMRRQQRFRGVLTLAAAFLCTIAAVSPIRAASAVATAINQKNGNVTFSYWWGEASEREARKRAIQYSVSAGRRNIKVIDSTSRKGYSAIVLFETADKKPHYAVSLAAKTPQKAIRIALRRAKAAGGRYAIVETTWNDAPSSVYDTIIKL